jgi:hypothetical protein
LGRGPAESANDDSSIILSGDDFVAEVARKLCDLGLSVRAGKVLSTENEDCLRQAQDHLQALHDHHEACRDHCAHACDMLRAVLDNTTPGDPDGNPDDIEQDAIAAMEARGRRARLLKLRAS